MHYVSLCHLSDASKQGRLLTLDALRRVLPDTSECADLGLVGSAPAPIFGMQRKGLNLIHHKH